MGNSPEEQQIHEKIRISNLKHRGNIHAVAREVGYPWAYVQKILYKLKRDKQIRNETYDKQVADTLCNYIIEGHQSRVAYFEEMLRTLQTTEQFVVSDCCRSQFRMIEKEGRQVEVCRICSSADAKKIPLNQLEVFKMEIDLLIQLRNEAKALSEFAAKHSFIPTAPRPPIIKQDFLVIGGDTRKKIINKDENDKVPIEVTAEEVITLKQINEMPPAEREKLRMKIYREILQHADPQSQSTPQEATTEVKQ